VYFVWTWLFNRPQLPLHNLAIMAPTRFCALFEGGDLTPLHCGCHGTFSFWLFTAKSTARGMRYILRLLILAQRVLNVLFRLAFRGRGAESAWLSPGLLYIGRRGTR
jgi:hypothetical protein